MSSISSAFGLLIGHLVGDYILQNDWMAANKTKSHFACAVHCLVYTFAVACFTLSWMPWWGLLVCFLAHYPLDRWRLAYHWMNRVSQQAVFAEKMSPWSVIVVDNTFHLIVLWLIAVLAGV